MFTTLLIFLGAGLGGIARMYLSSTITQHTSLTYAGTITVNLLGCFFIGLLLALSIKGYLNQSWALFFIPGLFGGFTTFSAFSSENVLLLQKGLVSNALLNITISIGGGILLTYIGYFLIQKNVLS